MNRQVTVRTAHEGWHHRYERRSALYSNSLTAQSLIRRQASHAVLVLTNQLLIETGMMIWGQAYSMQALSMRIEKRSDAK